MKNINMIKYYKLRLVRFNDNDEMMDDKFKVQKYMLIWEEERSFI